MSVFDSMATVSTVSVLAGSGVAKMRYFSFEGHMFSPLFLAGLAEDIKNNYLHVSKDSTKDGSSGYDAFTNTIYLNFLNAGSIEEKGMVVHEATHAMFDFQGRKMDIATSESLSYIAQCMYVRLNGNFNPNDSDSRLGYWEEDKETGEYYHTVRDMVFKVGWKIAGKIIAGGSSNMVFSVDPADVSDMRCAVSAHPFYASKATSQVNFNGYLR